MHLIVIGAGPVGASLVEQALEGGHDVTLIEADAARAEVMAQRFDARVLCANIAEGDILQEAAAADADALVATTDDDAANLMAMVLAREAEVPTMVSVVNDEHHQRLFERLGVHVLRDPDAIVAHYLYSIVCRPEVQDAVALPCGGFAFDLELGSDAALVGKTPDAAYEEKLLSEDVRIVWVRRAEGKIARLGPDRRFEAGDRITMFAPQPLSERELRAFGSTGST